MFKAGDKVKYKYMRVTAEVLSGPHPSMGTDRYLIKKADGNVSLVKVAELSAINPERERVAKLIYTALHGGGRWDFASTTLRDTYLRAADAVLERPKGPLAVGDHVRILQSSLEFANVRKGDVLRVTKVMEGTFQTEAPRANTARDWVFTLSGEGIGWERV